MFSARNRMTACLLVLMAGVGCSDTARTERGTLDEAREMLERAATHYQQVGREQALQDFTAKQDPFVDRDLYVFCYGPDQTISAHAADAGLVGAPVDELRDVDGKALGTHIMEVAEANPEGGLAEYKWRNPVTGQVEPKVSIVRKVGDDVCGVGAYHGDSES
jgi:signal transduction histidine kinase